MKPLNTFIKENKLFISIDIRKPPMLASYSLQQPFEKAVSTSSFISEDVFSNISLPFEKLKLIIKASDSKENENNVHVTG